MKFKIAGIIILSLVLSACGRGGLDSFEAPANVSAEQIFEHACTKCHGSDGGGMLFGMMFKLDIEGKTPQDLANTILTGREGMPAFVNLSEPQRLALATYIKSLKR